LEGAGPALGFKMDGDGFLVGVEQKKIPGVLPRAGRPVKQDPTRLTALRVFYLDDLGTEPGKRLGAGRTRFELGQVQNTDTSKPARKRAVGSHFFVPPTRSAFSISRNRFGACHI